MQVEIFFRVFFFV